VGKLDDAGRDRFHREQMLGGELLGLPRSAIPPTVADLRVYLDEVIASGILRVTEDAGRVADLIRRPPREVPWRPVLWQVAWWAFATLPPPVRDLYGVRWGPTRQLRLRGSLRTLRLLRPALPGRLREIVPARMASRRVFGVAE